ncbi:MAG: hypothetical protein HC868_13605 [Sphingomonadales bacterium]|nr:hypothetical protein [Sphingomonadales bacterium]
MGLATRRARAWLEIPARISQCKTPQDLIREQLQFWQTAMHDYNEGARRLTIAFGAIAPVGLNGQAAPPARDYISFAETKASSEDAPKRERRAA